VIPYKSYTVNEGRVIPLRFEMSKEIRKALSTIQLFEHLTQFKKKENPNCPRSTTMKCLRVYHILYAKLINVNDFTIQV